MLLENRLLSGQRAVPREGVLDRYTLRVEVPGVCRVLSEFREGEMVSWKDSGWGQAGQCRELLALLGEAPQAKLPSETHPRHSGATVTHLL